MNKPVIAIGLDAAEPGLVKNWIDKGELKTLARLFQTGTYQELKNFGYYRAETPWTTFLTGCSPQTTGYWGPVKYHAHKYNVEKVGAYTFQEYCPFYALSKDFKSAIFDMPQAPIVPGLNGVQVVAWGAHSPQVPRGSQPASLFDELIQKHGGHPAFGRDHANVYSAQSIARLKEWLETGIKRRAEICKDLLQRDDWNLLLTVFGEVHAACHSMWHLNDPNHPLYGEQVTGGENHLLSVFKAIDGAIAEIIAAAPDTASILVFSAHGMQNNNLDLTSTFFLAELLYRWNFPGKVGFSANSGCTEPILGPRAQRRWYREVWAQKYDPNPVTRWLRSVAPTKAHRIFDRACRSLGISGSSDFVSPYTLQNLSEDFDWQPATWYKRLWPKMKAFALPSFSEGYIRVNLKGREPQGVVNPSDYEAVLNEITAHLQALTIGRTGEPAVADLIRTRTSPTASDLGLPDADLIVMWNEQRLADMLESPSFGRIGPVPYQRTGSHTPNGFMLLHNGSGYTLASERQASALDLAPTLLDLMGAPIPDYFEGQSLLTKQPVAVA
ncbi:MAG: alkaline phosphatase family protein [Synechococcales bacterium]|nr:alkaline phosphatase family protein [Synechococcales bacterium]